VIHGSVWQTSEHCRVTVNLIRIPDGIQLWAGEYDCNGSDMLPALSGIAANVLREVTAHLGLQRSPHTFLALAA
jgi:TolB-like protein